MGFKKVSVELLRRGVLHPILVVLTVFIKRRPIVLIAGRNARSFSDNPRYLFEFLVNDDSFNTQAQVYFYTKSKTVFSELAMRFPGKVLYAYHFKTLIFLAKAKFIVFGHGINDFFPYPIIKNNGLKIMNLFHAIALKRIGLVENFNDEKSYVKEMQQYDFFVSSSKEEAEMMQLNSFLQEHQMIVTGMPRNDVFHSDLKSQKGKLFTEMYAGKKTILYAPTFRDDGRPVELFPFKDANLEELDLFLKENDSVIIIRCHVDEFERLGTQKNGNFSNIVFQGSDVFPDVQDILPQIDMVITDYSSVCIDFLLTLRPMLFIPYDYDQYKSERGFLFEYFEATPGPKVESQTQFIQELKDYLKDPSKDLAIREIQRNRFHETEEGKSCELISKIILDELVTFEKNK